VDREDIQVISVVVGDASSYEAGCSASARSTSVRAAVRKERPASRIADTGAGFADKKQWEAHDDGDLLTVQVLGLTSTLQESKGTVNSLQT